MSSSSKNNENQWNAGLDFISSAISTITCSIVSTPQMMIVDNIMAGNYPNIVSAIKGLARDRGIKNGFYGGWWPGLVGKIPSYALTWTIFQQLKVARDKFNPKRPATNIENSIMGCISSATTVTIMIPMDTIKTRLVTQIGRATATTTIATSAGVVAASANVPYKGIVDCAVRVFREEGMLAFYKGLPPRLVSVVPMIGIQFGVYEFMKRIMMQRPVVATASVNSNIIEKVTTKRNLNKSTNNINKELPQHPPHHERTKDETLEEVLMECSASQTQPNPAPVVVHPATTR